MTELTRAQVEHLLGLWSIFRNADDCARLQQTDAALRARLEAVEGERDKLVKRCDEKSECISNDTNRFIVVTHRIKELCPEATSLENGIERLQQQLAAAEGRVQDNNDLVHILSNLAGRCQQMEEALRQADTLLLEINPQNFDTDDVLQQNASVICAVQLIREALTPAAAQEDKHGRQCADMEGT